MLIQQAGSTILRIRSRGVQGRGSGDEDLRLSRTHEHDSFLIRISLQSLPASIHHSLTQCTMHQHGCLQDMQLIDGVVRSLVDDHQYASFEL